MLASKKGVSNIASDPNLAPEDVEVNPHKIRERMKFLEHGKHLNAEAWVAYKIYLGMFGLGGVRAGCITDAKNYDSTIDQMHQGKRVGIR